LHRWVGQVATLDGRGIITYCTGGLVRIVALVGRGWLGHHNLRHRWVERDSCFGLEGDGWSIITYCTGGLGRIVVLVGRGWLGRHNLRHRWVERDSCFGLEKEGWGAIPGLHRWVVLGALQTKGLSCVVLSVWNEQAAQRCVLV